MKELVVDYIQSILSDVTHDVRSGRRLIALVGILGQGGVPENVQAETLKLSKFIVLREMFAALIEPISSFAKKREMMPTDRQITAQSVALIVKQRAAAIGLNPAQYSGHSLRAGFVTSAAKGGASTWKICQQTGHQSEAVMQRYIRDSHLFTDNPLGKMR